MTSMKLKQSDPDPPKKDYKIDVAVAITNINPKRKRKKRVNYESEKLQHCHVAVVTGGTSGSGWIVDAVALRFVECRRCWGRRCAGRYAARWWFESVPTWPPFPEADYAVLGGAASCDSLLDVLLDTRRRSVRIADRLNPQWTTKKKKLIWLKNVIDLVLSSAHMLTLDCWVSVITPPPLT